MRLGLLSIYSLILWAILVWFPIHSMYILFTGDHPDAGMTSLNTLHTIQTNPHSPESWYKYASPVVVS